MKIAVLILYLCDKLMKNIEKNLVSMYNIIIKVEFQGG